jgi:hypothetical protein
MFISTKLQAAIQDVYFIRLVTRILKEFKTRPSKRLSMKYCKEK